MISHLRPPVPHMHLPLRQVALCLDCDGCFEIGTERCPACASATWLSLSRFLEQTSSARRRRRPDGSLSAAQRRDDQRAKVRQLIVVARHRGNLYAHLKRAFAGNETVRVLRNRRVGERRVAPGAYATERRQGDRRAPRVIDGLLRAIGLVVVPQVVSATRRGAAR